MPSATAPRCSSPVQAWPRTCRASSRASRPSPSSACALHDAGAHCAPLPLDMHSHHSDVSRKLLIATIATAIFVVVELIAGIAANSLSLIGDAFHNFTDTLALLLALFAVRMERRPANAAKTYGYHRAGVLAAFINSGMLVAFTIYLFYEAVHRLRVPHAVDSRAMLVVAAAAFVLNAAITWWLHDEGREDLNVRSAMLHMLGDAASSVGIVAAALLIARTGQPYWD